MGRLIQNYYPETEDIIQEDVNLLKLIYELLKNQGYTISGAKKLLSNSSIKLDDQLVSGVQKKNFQGSLKLKAHKLS